MYLILHKRKQQALENMSYEKKNENIWAAELENKSLENAVVTVFKYVKVNHRGIMVKLVKLVQSKSKSFDLNQGLLAEEDDLFPYKLCK